MPLCTKTEQKPFFPQLPPGTKDSDSFVNLPMDKAVSRKHGPRQAALIEPGEEQVSGPHRRHSSSKALGVLDDQPRFEKLGTHQATTT